ncbi:TetR/AcrR family transcriptional regulator [Pseudokineococcus sp. 1T1Z-3]|uniref:TetR/AcrR family transcriptional regulator n=1 Tax=Pseudokineococcus sp. 1T1Z-3 TaxID=3132745 RepID=UPI0030A99AD2
MVTTTEGVRPARPSREQIDARILEVAAGLFAAQGIDGTSLQQVADAVGYSKTGLLHRFPSKQALLDAAAAEAERRMAAVLAQVRAAPAVDGELLRYVVRVAVEHPGLLDLVMVALPADATATAAAPSGPGAALRATGASARLEALAEDVVDALRPGAGPRERLQVVLALGLVVEAARLHGDRARCPLGLDAEELVHLVADLAGRVLAEPAAPTPAV